MKFKLIIALVDDGRVDKVLEAARAAGCTGASVITSVRGEGLKPTKSFMGLQVSGQRDMCLFLVEQHRASTILEAVAEGGRLEEDHGAGVVFQLDIEDAIGLANQAQAIAHSMEADEL